MPRLVLPTGRIPKNLQKNTGPIYRRIRQPPSSPQAAEIAPISKGNSEKTQVEDATGDEDIQVNSSKNTYNPNSHCSPLVPKVKDIENPSPSWEKTNFSRKRPFPVELDPELPEDIIALHKTHKCLLCDVILSSEVIAKSHYEGKPHAKKLKSLLEKRRESAAVTPTSSQDEGAAKKKKKITDGNQLYCKCCDLSFTSSEHATQHYLGRNHQRVLHGLKPLKAGYFNSQTGKWQRTPLDPTISVERLEESFKGKGKFFCDLCGVSATCQDQLDSHLVGQRHKKKALQSNTALTIPNTVTPNEKDSILASVIKHDEIRAKKKDFSIFRTPSGKYYCAPCDTMLNSENQFAQHVESKKHILSKKK